MITKEWAIEQIKKKWIAYKKVVAETKDFMLVDEDWYEVRRNAHNEYQNTMYPLKQHFGIKHFELVNILREAEKEMQ